jgi:hypothetical protein
MQSSSISLNCKLDAHNIVQRTPINFHFPAFSSSEESGDLEDVDNSKVSPSAIKFHFPSSSSLDESNRSRLSAFSYSHFHTPLCSNRSFQTAWSLVQERDPSPIPCTVLPFLSQNTSPIPLSIPACSVSIDCHSQSTMDDEEASLLQYVDSDNEDGTTEDSVSVDNETISSYVVINSDDVNVLDTAKLVFEEGIDVAALEEEQFLLLNSTVNMKAYEKNKKGIEECFFDKLEKFVGTHLKKLALYAEDGFRKERLFYIKLHRDRREEKRFILNKCLLKIALKWRNQVTGKHMQPSTWATKLKYLFAMFRKKNINYHFAMDFNGDGEFHVKSQWTIEKGSDPTFAEGVKTATFDMDADLKIHQKFQDGKFNPFSLELTEEAYDDRLKYAIWVLGRYFLLRGKNEIAFCTWAQVKFHELTVDGVTEKYVELCHSYDKTHQLKITNTTPRDSIPPRIYANEKDELCPHKFLTFFQSLCSPSQERVLCNAANKKNLKLYCKGLYPYMYNEFLPVGGNTVGPLCVELAKDMGFKNWKKCTGHELRKMGITHEMSYAETNIAPVVLGMARHKNYQTSLAYQKPNDAMYKIYNKALAGKHVVSSPLKTAGSTAKCVTNAKEVSVSEQSAIIEDSTCNDWQVVPVSEVLSEFKKREERDTSVITPNVDLPLVSALTITGNMSCGGVSSITGAVTDNGSSVSLTGNPPIPDGVITPYYGGLNQPVISHHQSNHIHRNTIVRPTVQDQSSMYGVVTDSMTSHHMTERLEFLHKVAELELMLEYQKQKYEELKQNVKGSKNDSTHHDKPIVISTCILV